MYGIVYALWQQIVLRLKERPTITHGKNFVDGRESDSTTALHSLVEIQSVMDFLIEHWNSCLLYDSPAVQKNWTRSGRSADWPRMKSLVSLIYIG